MFCLKTYFDETSYHIETNQMFSKANQLTGFYMKWVCVERYLQIDYIHSGIMFTSLRTVLNCIILKNLSWLLLSLTILMNCALSLQHLVILSIAEKYKSWYGDVRFFWVVRRIISGNLDIITFYFASLNSKQIIYLKMIFQFKKHIVM